MSFLQNLGKQSTEVKNEPEKKKEQVEHKPRKKEFQLLDLDKVLKKVRSISKDEYPSLKWLIHRCKDLNRDSPLDEFILFVNKFYEELI